MEWAAFNVNNKRYGKHFFLLFKRVEAYLFSFQLFPSFNFQIRAVVLCCCQTNPPGSKLKLLCSFPPHCLHLFPPCPMTISGTRDYMETLIRMKHVVKLTSHYLFREEHPQTRNYPAGAATGSIMSYLGLDACEELIRQRRSYLYFWKAFMSLAFLRRW